MPNIENTFKLRKSTNFISYEALPIIYEYHKDGELINYYTPLCCGWLEACEIMKYIDGNKKMSNFNKLKETIEKTIENGKIKMARAIFEVESEKPEMSCHEFVTLYNILNKSKIRGK